MTSMPGSSYPLKERGVVKEKNSNKKKEQNNVRDLGDTDEHVFTTTSTATRSGTQPMTSDVGISTLDVIRRQLQQSSKLGTLMNRYTANAYADGETEYDEYQVAWRELGFFIDCDDVSRWDDDDAYGGSDSGDNGGTPTGVGCHRYVLWAAYIDPNYEGGGIGEYQYYSKYTGEWDTTPCYVSGEGSRCAKMDCHLENTEWRLLGLFKHRNPDDWMEQLFKHEGMCIWTEEEYSFMKGARKAWPSGCVESSTTSLTGKSIYYAIKPVSGGSITFGLYSDEKCNQPYNGVITVEQVVGNALAEAEASGSGDGGEDYSSMSFSKAQSYWDDAFDIFKICQPW